MTQLDGNKIKKYRQDKGLTQDDIAKLMKLYPKTYARKEKQGDFNEFEVDQLLKILKISQENIAADCVEEEPPLHESAIERLVASQEREIKALQETIELLKKQLQISSTELAEWGLVNNAHLKVVLECIAKQRALMEKKPIEKIRAEHDTILSEQTKGMLKMGK